MLSAAEALDPGTEIDRDVVVYDALGANDGALVAEALANAGRVVRLVTPYETVMPYGGISHRMETPDILRRKLAAIYTGAVIGVADGRQVTVVRPDGESVAELNAGTIVAITAPNPRIQLAEAAARIGLSSSSSATRWRRAPRPTPSGTARRPRCDCNRGAHGMPAGPQPQTQRPTALRAAGLRAALL